MRKSRILLPILCSVLMLSACSVRSSNNNNSVNNDTTNTDQTKHLDIPNTYKATIEVNNTKNDGTSWSTVVTDFQYSGIELNSVAGAQIFGTGEKAMRIGTSSKGGTLSFTFEKTVVKRAVLYVSPFEGDETHVKVTTTANAFGETIDVGDGEALYYDCFNDDTDESEKLTISSNERFYLYKVELLLKEPDPIYPTSISLSGATEEIRKGGSVQLNVKFTPTTTNQTAVTWTSSKPSVATVTDEGLVEGVTTGETIITAKAKKEDNTYAEATYKVTVNDKTIDDWTILIYLCGSDLESNGGYGTADLKEIAAVNNQPEGVNVVIEAGGASSWKSAYSSVISANKLNRFHLANKSYVKDEQITKANMGLTATFQAFLEWGLTTYPAKKTGVIFWNHGGGQYGVCYDENFGDDNLTDNEVKIALGNVYSKLGIQKLEWVGYDACLMQLQEIAEFNSPYFNYMVGAQESEAGAGWDYDTWIDDVFAKKDTETILKAICTGFINDNGGVNATGGYYYDADQTLSVLNLQNMPAYKQAWEDMAAQLMTKITSSNASTFRKNVIGKTKPFAGSDYSYFGLFDAQHFLTILGNNDTFNPGSTYINAVKEAYQDLLVYNCVQKEGAHDAYGLSMFFPTNSSNKKFATATYSNFTNWNSLCTSYYGSVSSTYSA